MRTWPGFVVVLLLALVLRLAYVGAADVDNPLRGDSAQYFAYAWNLVHAHVFSMSPQGDGVPQPDAFREPGYPMLLALGMTVWGSDFSGWYRGVLVAQSVLGALSAALVVPLARHWMPGAYAIAAGVLAAVWPHHVAATQNLLSEVLFGFLYVAGLSLLAEAVRRQRGAWAIAAGLVLACAALTNPVVTPLLFLLPLLMAWQWPSSRPLALRFVLAAVLLPAAWQLRHRFMLPAQSVTAASRAGQNLVQGSWPEFHVWWRQSVGLDERRPQLLPEAGRPERMAEGARALQAEQEDEAAFRGSFGSGLSRVAARLMQRPFHYGLWYLVRKPALMWSWDIRFGQGDIYVNPTSGSPYDRLAPWRAMHALCRGIDPLLALMALVGVVGAWLRRHREPAAVLVSGSVVFVTAVYAALQAEPRFSTPFRPLEAALALGAAAQLAGTYSDYRQARLPKAAT